MINIYLVTSYIKSIDLWCELNGLCNPKTTKIFEVFEILSLFVE